MSNLTNQQKATYALLADNVYWDVRNSGYNRDEDKFEASNWTPVPDGWMVTDEISGSGLDGKVNNSELDGFTARAYQNAETKEIIISVAGTEDFTTDPMWKGLSGDGKTNAMLGFGLSSVQASQAA